jgi:hypothetical protein
MTRPSARRALRVSSSTLTSRIRSPALGSEVPTPSLQEKLFVGSYQGLDPLELMSRETEISSQPDRGKPELRRLIVAVDVNMGWFVRLMTEEVYPVRARTENGGHLAREASESEREPGSSQRGLTDQALSCRPPVKVPRPDRRAPAEPTPNRAAAGWSIRQADQAAAGQLQCLVRPRSDSITTR